jgi:hypothetical protein
MSTDTWTHQSQIILIFIAFASATYATGVYYFHGFYYGKERTVDFIKSGFFQTFGIDLKLTHGFSYSTVTYKWAKLLYRALSLVMMTLLSYGTQIFLLGHLGPSAADACAYVSLLPITCCMLFSGCWHVGLF